MTMRGRIFIGFVTLFLFLFLVFLKVYSNARDEFQKGEKALKNKDFNLAITHFNRAIHWYSPGSKAVMASIQALWEIGTQSEARGDNELALQAFRSLSSSLYSARSFYTPYPDWIKKSDDRIATIIAQQEVSRSPDKSIPFSKKKEEVLKILKRRTEPNVFWSLICELGFIGWIGCSIAFILRVFTGEKGFNPRRAIFWGVFIIFFYALWVLGMLHA